MKCKLLMCYLFFDCTCVVLNVFKKSLLERSDENPQFCYKTLNSASGLSNVIVMSVWNKQFSVAQSDTAKFVLLKVAYGYSCAVRHAWRWCHLAAFSSFFQFLNYYWTVQCKRGWRTRVNKLKEPWLIPTTLCDSSLNHLAVVSNIYLLFASENGCCFRAVVLRRPWFFNFG